MKSLIPKALIFSRLILGLMLIALSYFNIDSYKAIAMVSLTIGLLTDIFDGIIARHLHISTQNLRRLDSAIDQIFLFQLQSQHIFNALNFSGIILLCWQYL